MLLIALKGLNLKEKKGNKNLLLLKYHQSQDWLNWHELFYG